MDESVGSVGQALTPAAPVPISPSGSGASTMPTFRWNSSATATGYRLWVQDSTGFRYNNAYTAAAAGCDPSGECFVTPTTVLEFGAAVWWVRGTNAEGPGVWSVAKNFDVTPTIPAVPTLVAPTGTISTTLPTYRWNRVAGTAQYSLWVNDAIGNRINTLVTPAQAGCTTAAECAYTSTTALNTGNGGFWVRAQNSAGSSAWSAQLTFKVSPGGGGTAPDTVTLTGPSGTVTTSTPTYQWEASAGATNYFLWVNSVSGVNYVKTTYTAAQVGCDVGTACAIAPSTPLPNGQIRFWVQASNGSGTSAWSSARVFGVNAP